MSWQTTADIVDLLLRPLVFSVAALVLGCVLLWIVPSRRIGRYLTTAGLAGVLGLAYGVPFQWLGVHLERKHPAILDIPSVTHVKWVVVLGGGHRAGEWLPLTSRISSLSLHRVAEGVRLHRELPDSTLVFSGAATVGGLSVAEVGRELGIVFGSRAEKVVVVSSPRNTAEEARCVRELVANEPFVLVTSAVHMPRAVALFRNFGLDPIPAPTGHRSDFRGAFGWTSLLPSASNIADADAIFHELLGLAWVKVGGAQRIAQEGYAVEDCAQRAAHSR